MQCSYPKINWRDVQSKNDTMKMGQVIRHLDKMAPKNKHLEQHETLRTTRRNKHFRIISPRNGDLPPRYGQRLSLGVIPVLN